MLRVCLSLVLLGGVIGCGGGPTGDPLPETAPVSGIVTLDDKPLASATVTFLPQGQTKGTDCVGVTDESGKYMLKQQHGTEGAPPGNYKVTVSLALRPDGTPVPAEGVDDGPVATETLSPRYSDVTATTLGAEVPAGGKEFNFDLKSK